MSKKRSKKIIKIVIITLVCLILVLAVAAVLVYNYAIKPNADKLTDAVNVILTDDEIVEEIKPYLTNEEFDEIMKDVELPKDLLLPEEVQPSDGQTNKKNQGNKEDNTQNKNENKDKSSYSSTYEYVKKNVDKDDFKIGVQFASRIDIRYVLGLVSGGLTAAEKQELKQYLKARFSSSEIATGIKLYSKYSHLLK